MAEPVCKMESSAPSRFTLRIHSSQAVASNLSAHAFPPFVHVSLVINDVEFLRERKRKLCPI